jgi:nucleoside phosphorylase
MDMRPSAREDRSNMLYELHVTPPQPEHDKNIYTFGAIAGHNGIIVCQGDMGKTAAAVVATRMDGTFRRLRFGLLVGIAGGLPDQKDVRLGDVVVSKGDGLSGGVLVHDRGKVIPGGFESRPFLNGVPEVLRNAISELESRLMDQDSKILKYIRRGHSEEPTFSDFGPPTALTDKLFKSGYAHTSREERTCSKCENDFLIPRPPRNGPVVHFGVVASGDQVIKDSLERLGILATHRGVLAVEMEAAGLMNVFGCATVRGICDYADSHKNDGWQPYAAAAAAAVAKEILETVPVPMVIATPATTVTG